MHTKLYCLAMLLILASCAPVTIVQLKRTPVDEQTVALAEKGDPKAQFHVGALSLANLDLVTARHWFRKAAEQGDAGGQSLLAHMFHWGLGGPRDYAEALKWYRKAAEQGDSSSHYGLGSLYAEGHGVPKDSIRAYMWLSLSLAGAPPLPENSKKEATEMLAKLTRSMTPQELAKAQAMAEACCAAQFQRCDE